MNHTGASLVDFFESIASRGEPLILATVIETLGSTYRKAGAQMLIARDGAAAGLLSGGCLEADLLERARTVLAGGEATVASYDTRSSDDLIWGIGLGCEGAMKILLQRLGTANGYQPFAFIARCHRAHLRGSFALVVASRDQARPLGTAYCSDDTDSLPPSVARALDRAHENPRQSACAVQADEVTYLVAPVPQAPRVLVLGAGPDAMPLVEIGGLMGWQITVLDHRPAYAVASRFARASRVALQPPDALPRELAATDYDAAVVMSHHLLSDRAYLAALAESNIPYIGLLGPAPRRQRLMTELGEQAARLGGRLRGPIGLDIGANTPETIALAITSEIQAALASRPGGPMSGER